MDLILNKKVMNGNHVPNADHITRYCGGSKINEDGSINGMAFIPREDEETYDAKLN